MNGRVPDPPTDPPAYYDADPECPMCDRLVDDADAHTDECPYRGLDMETLDDALKQSKLDPGEDDVVARRKALMVQLEKIEIGTPVELTYESSRGSGERTITANARPSPDSRAIFAGHTDDLTGDVVVTPIEVNHELYGELRVISTGSRHTKRQTTCGDLTAIDVKTGGETA